MDGAERREVAPTCDGVVLDPGTADERRLSWADAKRVGVEVEDPAIQALIDRAEA